MAGAAGDQQVQPVNVPGIRRRFDISKFIVLWTGAGRWYCKLCAVRIILHYMVPYCRCVLLFVLCVTNRSWIGNSAHCLLWLVI